MHHKDNTRALQFLMVEGTQGIGHIHTLAAFGSIDLERFGKIDGQAHLAGQLNAQNTVFQHIGMKDNTHRAPSSTRISYTVER